MDNFRSRFPFYKDDADYTTNAPSYYDDLARKNKLIQHLAEKIYDYDTILKTSLEEIEQILEQVIDKIGEGFNAEIADLLILWVEDGTLDHIINETLMNKKADKTELEALETALNNAMTLLETSLTTQMTDFENNLTSKQSQFENESNQKLTQLSNDLANELADIKQDIKVKFHNQVQSLDMIQFNMQKRKMVNDQSYTSLQGACFLGGAGNNIDYALAFLPTDGNPNNMGVISIANSNQLIDESESNALKLYHANGMDFNPETNTIYVAHGNEQIPGSFKYNNDVSEISKNGNRIIRVISPKGLPEGRRVKYFSYDKVTGKKYLGDDLGIYEVDNQLNVLKVIDFPERFTNYKNWGLGQTATVHNDSIFYLLMGPPTIAQFSIDGDLEVIHQLPKFTKEGVFVGVEPQALFFDNEDNLYMVSRTDAINFNTENQYNRIFKMSPFTGTSSDSYFIGTHNTRTPNTIYVTANPTSPFVTGSRSYPFHSLDEAITHVITAEAQQGFQTNIVLDDGNHGRSDIRTNGIKLKITGENYNSYFDELRFYNTDVILEGIHLNNPYHDYLIYIENGTLVLNGVRMNGQGKGSCIYADGGSIVTGTNLRENSIRNAGVGIYANASLILGTIHTLGLTDFSVPVETSSSGYAPFLEEKGYEGGI